MVTIRLRLDLAVPTARPLVAATDLLESGPVVRHDSDKLGPLLCALAGRTGRERFPQSRGQTALHTRD